MVGGTCWDELSGEDFGAVNFDFVREVDGCMVKIGFWLVLGEVVGVGCAED